MPSPSRALDEKEMTPSDASRVVGVVASRRAVARDDARVARERGLSRLLESGLVDESHARANPRARRRAAKIFSRPRSRRFVIRGRLYEGGDKILLFIMKGRP